MREKDCLGIFSIPGHLDITHSFGAHVNIAVPFDDLFTGWVANINRKLYDGHAGIDTVFIVEHEHGATCVSTECASDQRNQLFIFPIVVEGNSIAKEFSVPSRRRSIVFCQSLLDLGSYAGSTSCDDTEYNCQSEHE